MQACQQGGNCKWAEQTTSYQRKLIVLSKEVVIQAMLMIKIHCHLRVALAEI